MSSRNVRGDQVGCTYIFGGERRDGRSIDLGLAGFITMQETRISVGRPESRPASSKRKRLASSPFACRLALSAKGERGIAIITAHRRFWASGASRGRAACHEQVAGRATSSGPRAVPRGSKAPGGEPAESGTAKFRVEGSLGGEG